MTKLKIQIVKEKKHNFLNKKLKFWQKFKIKLGQNLKKKKNLNCDQTQKLKLWQTKNSNWNKKSNVDKTETQIVTKPKNQIMTNLKKKNTLHFTKNLKNKSNFDQTQKLKLWQNSKTSSDQQKKRDIDNKWDVLSAAFCDLAMFFFLFAFKKSRIREIKHLLTNADSSTDAIGGWTNNTSKPLKYLDWDKAGITRTRFRMG